MFASSAHEPIDLTQDDDSDGQPNPKRVRSNPPMAQQQQQQQPAYAHPGYTTYPPRAPYSPYAQQQPPPPQSAQQPAWPAPYEHQYTAAQPAPYYRPQYATPPAYPAAPVQPAYYESGYAQRPVVATPYQQQYAASPAAASPVPRNVIDLTGTSTPPTATTPTPTGGAAQQPAKDVRRDVVCIGQISATALVLYPIHYVSLSKGAGLLPTYGPEDMVPVRLKYEGGPSTANLDPSDPRKRPHSALSKKEETIQISAPQLKTPTGEPCGGEEFGVVEQRVATVIGPLMAKVLIRLEASVKRAATTATILPLRILVFTPRGNVRVVAEYLSAGNIILEHPSIPYNPAMHRDNPQYMNPHNPPPGAADYRSGGGANRWNQQVVAGKSVEVQRSQVDEVFQSLRSGEDLTETDPGPNVATNLYPHQKKALTFLLEREKEKAAPDGKSGSLWQQSGGPQSSRWVNLVTGKEVFKQPPESKGAILADDMGLGKTISVVSLMARTMDAARIFAYGPIQKITLRVPKSNPEPPLTAAHFAGQVWGMPETAGDAFELDEAASSLFSGLGAAGKKGKGKRETQKELEQTARVARIKAKSRATLIICPLSTIANWEDQFREHWGGEVSVVGGTSPTANAAAAACSDKNKPERRGTTLKLYIYHGAARRPDTSFLADFDAVITTYSTLATEFSKQTKSTALYEDENAGAHHEEDDSGSESFSDTDQNGNMVIRIKEKKKPKKRPPGAALAAGLEVSSALQQIHWFRIVLDEAHSIKETSTIASRACCDLMADRRLALTGTPVQNKLDDVYALIKFLRVNPFDDKSVWSEFIGGPAKFGQPLGVARLQTIMKSVTLRRTKESKDANGKRILDLPPRYDEVRYLKFDEREKVVYDSYYTESKAEFSAMRKNGEVMKNYVGILQKILRLRQICDHYELVAGKDEAPTATAESAMDYDQILAGIARDGLTVASATAIFALLREAGTAQCVECGSDLATPGGGALLDGTELEPAPAGPSKRGGGGRKAGGGKGSSGSRGPTRATSPAGSRPVLTRCQHLYCIECFRLSICPNWPKVRAEIHRACSACQADLAPLTDAVEVSPDGIVPSELTSGGKPRPPKKEKRQKGAGLLGYNSSTKVRALMSDLMQSSQTNPHSANYDARAAEDIQMVDDKGAVIDQGLVKTVVFSQWTSMLDKIEDALEEANIVYDRLDGTMKREERTRAMDALKYDPKNEVLLVSLRAGGVGLNLTAARRVYLMDPYWNPAVENQAVDRIHRLGQTHPVKTIKMIMEDSIETRLLEVQARKTQLANMTLGQPLSKAEMMQRRMEELNELLK